MSETLTLKGWGGQNCSVKVTARDDSGARTADSRVYASFLSEKGFEHPSLEIAEVRRLLAIMESMDK